MKASIEVITRFVCDRCGGWWSAGDKVPTIGDSLYCPYCGYKNLVNAMANGKGDSVQGVAWLRPTVHRQAVEFEGLGDEL